MAGNEFLDKAGLSVLWERIQQLVYECGCDCESGSGSGSGVKYRLESDGTSIALIGSDGSRSVVTVPATASCDDEDDITVNMSLDVSVIADPPNPATLHQVVSITTSDTIENATLVLERKYTLNGDIKTVETWTNLTLTGTSSHTADESLDCEADSIGESYVNATLYVGDQIIATATDNYEYNCSV